MATVLSLLGALLIALQLILLNAVNVLAAPVAQPQDQPQDISFAGVSVVRVLSTYTPENGTKIKPPITPSVQCTGLGVIVSSWQTTNAAEMNNWLLTDGKLVDPTQESCDTAPSKQMSLTKLEVFLSSAYHTDIQFAPVTLPGQQAANSSTPTTIRCQQAVCSDGLALVAFQEQSIHTLPFVNLATTDRTQEAKIALSQAGTPAGTVSAPPPTMQSAKATDQYRSQVQQFMTPQRVPTASTATVERGTPIVNSTGELTGISTGGSAVASVSDFASWINSVPELKVTHVNPVQDAWKSGISAYFGKNYPAASAYFQTAVNANALFDGAKQFKLLSDNQIAASKQKSTTSGGSEQPIAVKFLGITFNFPDMRALALLACVIFGVLLLLVIALLIRGRTRRRRVFKDYNEAERRAEQDAQRIAAMEAAQGAQRSAQSAQSSQAAAQPPFAAVGGVGASPVALGDLHCPNCGNPVMRGDNFCSNCRMVLSPSESGHHMRVMPQPAPEPLPPAPPPQYSPVRSIAEQPTIEMPPEASHEQSTLELASPVNGQGDGEKTVPYSIAIHQGRGSGYAVGTRSDPGIKRKYKPNEDSLFAAQWEPDAGLQVASSGLYVIADGMGGHANGQDASRSAIQTIVDFMLPKLSKNIDIRSTNPGELLANAVQHANQVVHQHNLERRADMGTTVTAALIVGTTAYVTNVGDSRTYLYREPEGLTKITNDHSVVASLVDAGIIKPDDIYTHPKRNQIYRSLGEKSQIEVDTFVVQLQPGDRLLLCSDGLWDMVRDPKIESIVKSTFADPKMTADMLIQAALDGGGEDNVSVIVVSVTEKQTGNGNGMQLLAKPNSVQMPKL